MLSSSQRQQRRDTPLQKPSLSLSLINWSEVTELLLIRLLWFLIEVKAYNVIAMAASSQISFYNVLLTLLVQWWKYVNTRRNRLSLAPSLTWVKTRWRKLWIELCSDWRTTTVLWAATWQIILPAGVMMSGCHNNVVVFRTVLIFL